MITRYITFHNGNLLPELVAAQKAVFDHFDIPLEQVLTDEPHGKAIDTFLANEAWDLVYLFDIDCIPIKPYFADLYKPGTLTGAAQKANHIPGSQMYAGPCFMILERAIYEAIGRPSFLPTHRGDVAEEISYGCRDHGIPITYIMPTHVEQPEWCLGPGQVFGYGTTYGDTVYHAFESNARHHSSHRFIQKCAEVIGE